MAFPGATALTLLDVYDWIAPDGLRGGSAHMHLASAEGYLVLDGTGQLQTLGACGYAESELSPGDCLWFTPGIIHRLVNGGGLRLMVIMSNAGLPEAGDAVLTFPPQILADPAEYARAAAIPAAGGLAQTAARRRRDLAIQGYLALREEVAADGPGALDEFYTAAVRLVSGLVPRWREAWQAGPVDVTTRTRRHLDQIAAGAAGHLAAGRLERIARPAGPRSYGMCGMLTRYDTATRNDTGGDRLPLAPPHLALTVSQPLIAPTMPPTSLRWANMKMASAGTIDRAVKAKTRAVSWV
jgi:mannose-6-phosphate isomerase-like protein (cupin superfamily)